MASGIWPNVSGCAEAVASLIERSRTGLIRLEATDDNGALPIWINSVHISSFMG
jgi:hypothetical protein